MRLRHIEVFHAVFTTGSITRAADMLNVSQPSVSKVLGHAERQLGFALFDRVRGRLVPTVEGRRLHIHVAELYQSIGVVRRVAANLRAPDEGRVRIAATPTLGMEIVPSLVAGYLAEHPGVFFDIETLHHSELAAALMESKIDVAIALDPPAVAGILEQRIASANFVLLAPTSFRLAPADGYSLSTIGDLPYIALNPRSPLGSILQRKFEEQGVQHNAVARAETYHVAKALVARGVGVTIVDEVTAAAGSSAGVDQFDLAPSAALRISLLRLEHAPLTRVCEGFAQYVRTGLPPVLQELGALSAG